MKEIAKHKPLTSNSIKIYRPLKGYRSKFQIPVISEQKVESFVLLICQYYYNRQAKIMKSGRHQTCSTDVHSWPHDERVQNLIEFHDSFNNSIIILLLATVKGFSRIQHTSTADYIKNEIIRSSKYSELYKNYEIQNSLKYCSKLLAGFLILCVPAVL